MRRTLVRRQEISLEERMNALPVWCLDKAREMESYAQESLTRGDECAVEGYRNEADYFIQMYEQWNI